MTPPPEGTPGWMWLLAMILVGAMTMLGTYVSTRGIRRDAKVAAHEVKPNSGKSLADAVKRIEERQIEQAEELSEVRKDIGGLRSDLRQERNDRRDGDKSIWDTINRDTGGRAPWSPPTD